MDSAVAVHNEADKQVHHEHNTDDCKESIRNRVNNSTCTRNESITLVHKQ